MSGLAQKLWLGVAILLVVFLLAPILLLVLFAFTDRGIANFPIEHLSFKWWGEMVRHPQFAISFKNSMIIGLATAAISAVVGTMAAMGLVALPKERANLAMSILTLPVMLPSLVLAVALLSFFVSIGLKLGLWTVIISHVLFTQPFVILIVHARLANFDYRIVESARDLGASPLKAFLTVTLPIIRPIVIGAALIALALSIDDFIIASFTIGTGNTLPTLVWGMIRTGLTPAVNAIGTLILLFTIGSSLIALRLTRYRG
jgi:spermidine/putrescine transport system permease protein